MIPLLGHPVWVDDASFNPHYHLRHTRLPLPGDERQLKRLAGRLMSQQLDRGKPLWEMWFVEGLEGDRFAVVSKVHHCMVDGIGGVEMTTATMRVDPGPDPRLDEPPRPFVPRPAALGSRSAARRAPSPRCGGARGIRRRRGARVHGAAPHGADGRRDHRRAWPRASARASVRPRSTPLNVEIGPHRRFDWTAMDLAAVKAVKARLGGTVNDVVLAMVAGAMRRFLAGRGVDVDRLDFRAMVPVNLRAGVRGRGQPGGERGRPPAGRRARPAPAPRSGCTARWTP